MNLIAELKRRNVIKVGIAYVIAAWLLLQLTEVLADLLDLSADVGKIVIVLLIVGFVPTVIFAWAFELTPDGIKRESEIDRSQSIAAHTSRRLNVVIIGMLVIVAGYFFWESRFKARSGISEPPVVEASEPSAEGAIDAVAQTTAAVSGNDEREKDLRKSIVVLPFVNMSNDPDQEFFSDGLSEEILNALAKIQDLRVISRTSAFAFKGKELSIPQIAEQLDVSHVLEGSVRTAGNNVRITSQLIEVASDSHLWSDAYSRNLQDVFEIQEEISNAIASQLQVRLAVGSKRSTNNLEAYQLFLRGRSHYQARGVENIDKAITLLKQAVAEDPEYDEAWANLAAAALVRAFSTNANFGGYLREADRAAERAININPQSGLGYAVLGLRAYSEFNFELALSNLAVAIELNPNESNAYLWRGIVLMALGYIDRALLDLRAAEKIDPVFTNVHNWLVSAYLCTGQFELAQIHLDRLNELAPEFSVEYRGDIELARGDLDRAEQLALHSFRNSPVTLEADSQRAVFDALRDPAKTDAAEAVLLELRDQGSSTSGAFPDLLRIGRVETAVRAWEDLMERGRGMRAMNSLHEVWSAYDRKHLAHPALPKLFEKIGLADYWRTHGDPDFCRRVGDAFQCGAVD